MLRKFKDKTQHLKFKFLTINVSIDSIKLCYTICYKNVKWHI